MRVIHMENQILCGRGNLICGGLKPKTLNPIKLIDQPIAMGEHSQVLIPHHDKRPQADRLELGGHSNTASLTFQTPQLPRLNF